MMKKICVGAMALGLATVLAAPAAAQGNGGAAGGDDVTEHDFQDPELVEGGTVGPYGSLFVSRTRVGQRTLIRPRYTFVPEMLKTVENL